MHLRPYLPEVSSVPLQQGLRYLQGAFSNFWKRAKYPTFKSRKKSRAAAEYTRSAFDGKDTERLARVQRALARKVKGSANRTEAQVEAVRVYARIAARRRDNLHKLATRLVPENQTVVLEDLQARNILGNHVLARSVSDASWREFRDMLEAKCAWYGRDLAVVDRDVNAARNLAAGRAVRACGDGVRPIRRQSARHLSKPPLNEDGNKKP